MFMFKVIAIDSENLVIINDAEIRNFRSTMSSATENRHARPNLT